MKKSIGIVALSLSVALLAGCASVVVSPISESNRTASTAFDGGWLMTGVSTASKQSGPGHWQFTCGSQAGERLGMIAVRNGQAYMSWDEHGRLPAFVNDSGQFRLEIPTGIVAASSSRSDTALSNGDMTAIVYGSLEARKGNFTMGIAEFANNGCNTKVKFTRVVQADELDEILKQ